MSNIQTKPVHDFTILQGMSWNKQVTFKINGTPVDITGYTARMQLKRGYNQVTPEIELTNSNGRIVIAAGTGGILTLALNDTETDSLSGKYLYDLEIESPAGEVVRLLQGDITIDNSVTK